MRQLLKNVKLVSISCKCIGFLLMTLLLSSATFGTSVQAKTSDSEKLENSQQQKEVLLRGSVKDKDGLPLPGVAVQVKGTTQGTTTDADGEYYIMAKGVEKPVLVFSFVGMKTQEVAFQKGKHRIDVTLEEDSEVMEEVVVNGIFRRKSESFTGSAATYSQEKLKEVGNQNLLQSLSMIDPSFVIMDNNLSGSNPNTMLDISINGKTSIRGLEDTYGSNPDQPLFILDGFETTLARISDLSMDRVESITTLKDAASTAIYGAKAANGVVVIETKKPEPGKLRFSYSGNYQVAWADLSDYNLMNAAEKLEYEKLAGYYGLLDSNGEIISDIDRPLYYSRKQAVAAGLNSYWMNEPLRTALMHDHSINAEGGDAAFRYGLTFRYKNTEGVMIGSDRENIDAAINLSYRIDKLNFSNQTNIYYTDTSNNPVSFSEFSRANPYYAKRDANGDVYKALDSYSTISGTEYVYNPLWDYEQNNINGGNSLAVNNNFNVEYLPIKKLRLTARIGFTVTKDKNETFRSPFNTQFTGTEELKRGSYSRSDANTTSLDANFNANYGDVIGKHTYNFVGGAQITQNDNKSASYSAIGYITDQFFNPNFSNGYPEGGKPSSSVIRTRTASFFLNANYAYDMRYLLDFNVRSDGASVFGVNNPFNTTWSFGVAWNVHNEAWFKDSEILNTLKIRYSLGNPGDQNVNAKLANNIYGYYTSYQNIFGLAANVSQWGNKVLQWKRATQQNIGIDLDMFDSRFHLTADYTLKNTDPELIKISQPASTGTSEVPKNIGATKNRSFSMTARYDIIRNKDWRWSLTITTLNTKTKYDKIGNLLDKWNQEGRKNQTLIRYVDGASTTALWAVRSAGIDPMTGNEVFIKKDGSYTYEWNNSEEVICGDSTPDFDGHINSMLRYKGFSFGANFRYRYGGQIELKTLLNKVENISETEIRYNQDKRALHDRWQKPGDIAKFKRIDDTSETQISSRFIADENTFECKSISLGYETTSASWLKNLGLSSMNFRVYMNDIFRISTVKEERGLDYPFQRSISASLGLRF